MSTDYLALQTGLYLFIKMKWGEHSQAQMFTRATDRYVGKRQKRLFGIFVVIDRTRTMQTGLDGSTTDRFRQRTRLKVPLRRVQRH